MVQGVHSDYKIIDKRGYNNICEGYPDNYNEQF